MIALTVPALRLTGSAAATIDFGSTPSPLTGAFTIELWFRPDALLRDKAILTIEFGARMMLHVIREALWLVSPAGTSGFPVGFHWPVQEKYWFHMAVVYEKPNIRIVVEHGELPEGISMQWPQPTVVNAAEWEPRELNRIRLGSFEYQGTSMISCNGAFAELRIWNLACADGDLSTRRHERLIGNEAGLIGYWMLDEKEGGSFYDSSVSEHDGLIFDGAWEDERETRLWLRNGQLRMRQPSLSAPAQLEHLEQTKLSRLNAACAELDQTRSVLNTTIQVLEGQKAIEEQALADQAAHSNVTLEAKQRELAELTATLAKNKAAALARLAATRKIRLGDFIERLQDDIAASRDTIRAKHGRVYGLDNVVMDIKMVPGVGGVGLDLPDLNTKAAPGRLSTLTLRFRARPQEQAIEFAAVPPLEGYTEIFARRKLGEAGFRVDLIHQLVEDNKQHGRVLAQFYEQVEGKPGEAKRNSVITLVIGQSR